MRHAIRFLGVLLAAIAVLALRPAQAAPILDASHIREHTLANGLRIIVKEEHGWGVVAVGAYVRCGSLYDPPGLPGVAHFMEHMLFRSPGDDGEPAGLVAAVEGSGGQINADTSRDSTAVRLVTSPTSLVTTWPVLAKALMEVALSPELVDAEREIIAQELAEREGQALETLAQATWALAYPNHPYGRSVGGEAEALADITPEVLEAYHTRFYVPNNIALIVVGDVRASEVFAAVQEAFGHYAQRPVDWEPPAAEEPLSSPKVDVQTRQVNSTLIGLGFHGPGIRKKRDVCAMDLIYTVLSEGRKARLQTEVQDKELISGFQFDFITHKDDGLVLVTAVTDPAKELDARAAIMAEFARLAEEGITEEALDRAKRQLRNSYAFTNEAYSDQVGSMGFYEMIDTYRFAIDYVDAVNAVTAADVQATAARYLDPQKSILVILRPPSAPRPGGEV